MRALARGWKDDPETLPWLKQRAATDAHPALQVAAEEELRQGWKDDEEVRAFLEQLKKKGE